MLGMNLGNILHAEHMFFLILLAQLIWCLCAFISAVMQSLAHKNEWPLDKMHITVDVTKKYKEEFTQPAREGAYIHGLYLEGK